ncbi:MAG: hypothetical protein LUC88_08175 [Prevotella sp.]|nr:hypothetical protein [Prevotella sp.]
MNARRLAATETNIAYRTSDYERWQQLDFVVGIHVILSNNHTIKNSMGKLVRLYDICDDLSGRDEKDTRGRYPKTFKFTGWHPFCRCHAVSILKTEKELEDDNKRILDGEQPSEKSVNTVPDLPKEFQDWVDENEKRIKTAKSLPYFLTDNFVDGQPSKGFKTPDSLLWVDVYPKTDKGGYVRVHKDRLENSNKSKNEKVKYEKEKKMCEIFADNGYRMKMLKETPRVSSPDVMINGIPADLKKTDSVGNIEKYAKKAIRNQGAKLVLFQFTKLTPEIKKILKKLSRKDLHGKYFETDIFKVFDF